MPPRPMALAQQNVRPRGRATYASLLHHSEEQKSEAGQFEDAPMPVKINKTETFLNDTF